MLRREERRKFTDVSELLAASIIMSIDDGDSEDIWNVGKYLPIFTAQNPKRQYFFILTAIRTWKLMHLEHISLETNVCNTASNFLYVEQFLRN